MFAGSLLKNSLPIAMRLCPSMTLAKNMSSIALFKRPDTIPRIMTRPTLMCRNPVGFGLNCVRESSVESLTLMPVVKLLSSVAGYLGRKWWRSRGSNDRRQYREWANENRTRLRAAAGLAAGLTTGYLVHHVQRDPVSGRMVLLLYNDRVLEKLADKLMERFISRYGNLIMDPSDRRYKRVAALTAALVSANGHVAAIRDRQWRLVMLDDSSSWNAFALPNGAVFVFTGTSDSTNDDQLSMIIGHEMAHCALRHTNRGASVLLVANAVHAVFIAATWARLRPIMALFVHLCSISALAVLVALPHSRSLELEADRVGCTIAAVACVDVAQGPAMWAAMANDNDQPWYLSTHPSNSSRARRLMLMLPEALRLRKLAKCD